jgi:hypothetical protein
MSPFQGILTPDWGGRFEVGKSYNLVGYVDDVDESIMFWEVKISRIGMNYSRTLLERTAGNHISVNPVPGPEDFNAAKNSYLEIIMTSMNKAGLTSKESLVIFPTLSDVLITSVPPGLEVLVDDMLIVTPKLITTWKNHTLRLEALDQPPFYFQSWSDGGLRSRTFFVPTAAIPNKPKPSISVTFVDKSLSLKPKIRDCSTSQKCGLCEGHCQNDFECQGDLICFRKGGRGHVVPGCVGIDKSNTDWCTYPNATSSVSLFPKTRDCSASRPCGRCEGHCQNSLECQGSLVCFQGGGRGKYVPGCDGWDKSNTDWCTIAASIGD